MKTRKLTPIVLVAFIALLAVAGVIVFRSHSYVTAKGIPVYTAEFADMQAKHIKAAKKLGFQSAPLKGKNDVRRATGLVKVGSCRYFKVAEMKYGSPYLTQTANDRLHQISKEFCEECRANGLPIARLVVTSMLRTDDDVRELQKHNQNAVEDSPHRYGTTFDISWSHYQCSRRNADGNEYLQILAEILRRQRKDGTIFVRYEKAQRCFHITVCK